MITDLMCYFSVRVPAELRPLLKQTLAQLENDGLITWDGGWLRMTEAGQPWVRVAAAGLDTYREAPATRRSRAVRAKPPAAAGAI